jgi:hypothetical protein
MRGKGKPRLGPNSGYNTGSGYISIVSKNFDVSGTTSLNEEQNSLDQLNKVFPNPAKGITCIPVSLSENSNINLQLLDVTGRVISTITDRFYQKGDHKLFLDASIYDSGLYFIQMITDKTKLISPLVIR